MKHTRLLALTACLTTLAGATHSANVTTFHNDTARTGANDQETILTPTTVTQQRFGLIYTVNLDGESFGQPLYMSSVMINGSAHSVVYVHTENNTIYQIDANTSNVLGTRHFEDPIVTVTNGAKLDPYNIQPVNGITGTPVIDPATNTMYFVTLTGDPGSDVYLLHAIDIGTLADRSGSPVTISGSYPPATFNAPDQFQRPALLLSKGMVYVTFGSHDDEGSYYGWIFSYDETTLTQTAIWCTTPDPTNNGTGGGAGSIWMSGCGPAADQFGNLYVVTANGAYQLSLGRRDYSNSIVKLSPSLNVLDYFTPWNEYKLTLYDEELGSGGAVLVTGNALAPEGMVVTCGKDGFLRLAAQSHLGGYHPADDYGLLQTIGSHDGVPGQVGIQGWVGSWAPGQTGFLWNGCWSTAAYFGRNVFFAAVGDNLKSFGIHSTGLIQNAFESNTVFDFPGATPSISANSADPDPMSTAIVWAIQRNNVFSNDVFKSAYNGNYIFSGTNNPPILHAYMATDLKNELYNSTADQAALPSLIGCRYVTFSVPTIADGHVFFTTTGFNSANQQPDACRLFIFGLKPTAP